MPQDNWTPVDHYLADHLIESDPALEQALESSAKADLPPHQLSPTQAKFLSLLARLRGARQILEIGTLGGYSTIWLARTLPPDGTMITLEANPRHAEVARANLERAGLLGTVEMRVGKALESLPKLAAEERGPFDLVFIDADKANNPDYFKWAMKLTRPGSVIVVDNVIRDGSILDAHSDDPSVQGTRRLFELVSAEKRVSATALQTVGIKGYDGLLVALVTG